MENTIQVKGNNPASTALRVKALQTLNQLDDTALTRLAQLSKSSNAKAYLTNLIKWNILKGSLKI